MQTALVAIKIEKTWRYADPCAGGADAKRYAHLSRERLCEAVEVVSVE